jgi:hypothetical protein
VKDEPKETYYNFRDNDFEKLLDFELNNTIIYKNQLNEEIVYEINEVTLDYKNQLSQGSLVLPGSIKYFYYDEKVIELISNSTNFKIKYSFIRFPLDIEQAKKDDFTEYPSIFYGSIYLYLWNGINDNGTINIDYESDTVDMNINGTDYQNVIIIQSNNPNPIIYSSTPERNINVVYYDINNGIIGFDDLNNNQWRIIN